MVDQSTEELANFLEGNTPEPAQQQEQAPAAEPVVATEGTPAPPVKQEQSTPDSSNQDASTSNPAFDINNELVRITGGNVKSAEELQALLEKVNGVPDLESKAKAYDELQSQAKEDPFANDYYKKLNELAKGGATKDQLRAFEKVNEVGDIDAMDPLEAKVLALQLKDGLTEAQARSYVERKYKLNADHHTEQEVEEGTIDLKLESRADREYLKTHKQEVETSPNAQAERQQVEAQKRVEQHIAKLQPLVRTTLADAPNLFKGISINGGKDDADIKVDFVPSPDSLSGLEQTIQNFVNNSGENLPATLEGQEKIKAFAANVLAIANYKNWIVEAASQREKQVRAEYHNPTPVKRGQDNPNAGVNVTKSEQEKFLLDTYQ